MVEQREILQQHHDALAARDAEDEERRLARENPTVTRGGWAERARCVVSRPAVEQTRSCDVEMIVKLSGYFAIGDLPKILQIRVKFSKFRPQSADVAASEPRTVYFQSVQKTSGEIG